MPSKAEWAAEQVGIANITDAYDKLGLTAAGFRSTSSGASFFSQGDEGDYWSRTVEAGFFSSYLELLSDDSSIANTFRNAGFSVRCIKVQG